MNSLLRKLYIRSTIILLWLVLIGCALYWPTWEVTRYAENEINLFAWGDIIDPDIISAFEKETGIKVNVSNYFSNEELIVKLKATGGAGYDLILPSDYAVDILKKADLIKELDKNKFHYWKEINPSLIGHFYDPDNNYSIPWEWELYGFGIDKDYFKNRPFDPSWKMIFDAKSIDYQITMVNDSIEAVEFAAFYLFGESKSLTREQLEQVKNLLSEQRKWVTAYANFRGDYFLATKTCPLILASSSYIWRTMRLYDFVSYVVPKEGSFVSIENYLYSPESVAAHYTTYGYFPSTLHGLHLVTLDPQAETYIRTTPDAFKKHHFLQRLIPQQEVRDIWVDVKS
jgi:spermidine/putrescine transport system substrate-binding protein